MSPQEGPKRRRVVASGRFAQQFERATGKKWGGAVDRSIDDSVPPFFNELTDVQREKFQPLVGQVPSHVSVSSIGSGDYSVSMDLGEYNFWLISARVRGLELPRTGHNVYVDIPFDLPFRNVLGVEGGIGMWMFFGEEQVVSLTVPFWGMAKRDNPPLKTS
jgi:hypothetical protein